jgi:hypothetical protein
MLVVALAGLAMGVVVWGYRMWRLSGEYANRAQFYRALVDWYGRAAFIYEDGDRLKHGRDRWVHAAAARCAARARKYAQAARYPWLPVEPNPPER